MVDQVARRAHVTVAPAFNGRLRVILRQRDERELLRKQRIRRARSSSSWATSHAARVEQRVGHRAPQFGYRGRGATVHARFLIKRVQNLGLQPALTSENVAPDDSRGAEQPEIQ